MVILRIRQAETAMADGRLDEAYDQAVRSDVRQHRRGQRLITQLVDRLLDRGQAHVEAGQIEAALADYDRASRLGGNQPRIASLRADALTELDTRQQRRRRRGELVAAARRHIDRGELSVGARLVDQLGRDDAAVNQLTDEIAARRAAIESALARAEQAIERRQYETAIANLFEVRRLQPRAERLAELTGRLTQQVVGQVRGSIEQGRLDLASSLLGQLRPLADEDLGVEELDRVLHQCGLAASWLQRGNVQHAVGELKRLGQLLPGVDWVQQAIGRTEQAATSLAAVRGGPLGLIAPHESGEGGDHKPVATARRGTPPLNVLPSLSPLSAVAANGRNALPLRFLMQVDGAGSVVIARDRVTTVGPISSSGGPCVGLLAPANLPVVSIERMDEDYFLRCDAAVRVNGKSVSEKLLGHGDKIALSSRLEIRFLLPNAASTSAVLELTGARLPRQDVRRIILLDESMILGRGPAAHVRVSGLQENVVLHLRRGQLRCRVGEARLGPVRDSTVEMNKPVQIGPVSFVLTEMN